MIIVNSNTETKNAAYFTNAQVSSFDLSGVGSTPPPTPPHNIIFLSDFATGAIQPMAEMVDGWEVLPSVYPNNAFIETHMGRECCKLEFRKSDWPAPANPNLAPRAMINKGIHTLKIEQGKEYWLGWEMMIPAYWQEDTVKGPGPIIMQFHGSGGSNGSPPIDYYNEKGKWEWSVVTGEIRVNHVRTIHSSQTGIARDTWIRTIVRIIPSLGNDGVLQVWQNDVKIVDLLNQPNTYWGWDYGPPDPSDGMYISLGIYKSKAVGTPTDVDDYDIRFAEIRVAEQENGYAAVDPKEYVV